MIEYLSCNYDNEINPSKQLKIEALIALSSKLKNQLNEDYFKFYCISKSIKRVKRKFFI